MTPDEAWDKYKLTSARLIPFEAVLVMLHCPEMNSYSYAANWFADRRTDPDEVLYLRTLSKLTQ